MDNDHTRQQMFNLLSVVHDNKYGHLYREIDRQQIKYVVYPRKSSEENSDKQLKSIGDQFQFSTILAGDEGFDLPPAGPKLHL